AYIDFCAMVGQFPKQGFFMTYWGTEAYREAGKPIFAGIMARRPVPLVVMNHAGLIAAVEDKSTDDPLLPADAALLRDNYVHHWGPLWVAGKRFPAGQPPLTTVVAVEGWYTVEGAPVTID